MHQNKGLALGVAAGAACILVLIAGIAIGALVKNAQSVAGNSSGIPAETDFGAPSVAVTKHRSWDVAFKKRRTDILGSYFAPEGSPLRWHPTNGLRAYVVISPSGKVVTAIELASTTPCDASTSLQERISRVDFSNPPIPAGDDLFRGFVSLGCNSRHGPPVSDCWGPFISDMNLVVPHSLWQKGEAPISMHPLRL